MIVMKILLGLALCGMMYCAVQILWLGRSIRILGKAKLKLDQCSKLLEGSPTPSDELMAQGYLDQAVDLRHEASEGLGHFILRMLKGGSVRAATIKIRR